MSRGPMTDREPTAFVDESLRPSPNGLYVIASAVIIDDVTRARRAAEKVPPKQRRFHWKDEEALQRFDMLDLLVELGCGLWTYECWPCPTSKQERARAKCLERLVWDLKELGVDQLVIESRGAAANRKDGLTIGHSTRVGRASRALVYEHRRPTDDSALWLADGLAGAAASALNGRPEYRDRLGTALARKKVEL